MINIQVIDLEKAIELHNKIPEFNDNYIEKNFENKCIGNDPLILKLEVYGFKAGYLIGYDHFKDGSYYLWMGGILPEFRKIGHMKRLINYSSEWAKKEGYDRIRIKTRNYNKAMINLCVNEGF
ncbi:GNAT family N-acetyltransferase [Nanoarchaeota archaeon]